MKYQKLADRIEILDCEDFCPKHILECGQIFCYKKIGEDYIVYPQDKCCYIAKSDLGYNILTNDVDYFENFFDLKTDYSVIKKDLGKYKELEFPLTFGGGIRILKQELLETIISFIISANNNIKRITATLDKIRMHFGKTITNNYDCHIYAFPTLEELSTLDENFFKSVGAGYRAPYLVETISKLNDFLSAHSLENSGQIETKTLLNDLLKLKGVGRKVAECILLFGYGKQDVFPVDTWIKKIYSDIFGENKMNADQIGNNLISRYGKNSGYAQQYLFYSKRENNHI